MNIITAEKARKITNDYIPYEIKSTVKYVMKNIASIANIGCSCVSYPNAYTPYTHYTTIKSEIFKNFIESLGYKYEIESCCFSEWVTISW